MNISAKFDSMNKTKTTFSESKEELEISGKGLVTALAFKTKVKSPKYKSLGMPSDMSVRRTFTRLLRSLRILRNYFMRRRGPNISLLSDISSSKRDCEVYDEIR